MKTIELNEQQVETLKFILEAERINENTSATYNIVVNQIISKLEEE
jgi:hypothetical protein